MTDFTTHTLTIADHCMQLCRYRNLSTTEITNNVTLLVTQAGTIYNFGNIQEEESGTIRLTKLSDTTV